MSKQLKLSNDKKIFGLCAGIAEFFGWDTQMVRIITIILAIITCSTVLWAYLIGGIALHVINK